MMSKDVELALHEWFKAASAENAVANAGEMDGWNGRLESRLKATKSAEWEARRALWQAYLRHKGAQEKKDGEKDA